MTTVKTTAVLPPTVRAAAALSDLPGTSVALTLPEATPQPGLASEPPEPVRPLEPETLTPNAQDGVRAALSKYEAAYSALSVAGARAVWPTVNARSLERAFDGLESQRLSLGQCVVTVDGLTARADCTGTATWTPKIGGGTRLETRRWLFELKNAGGEWQIVRADAR